MWAEPAVVRFIGGSPLSHEEAWGRFLRHAGHWERLGFGYFAIEDLMTGALLGQAGFQDLRRTLIPSIEGTLEAGWALAVEAHGKGFAEEAMRVCLNWAKQTLPEKGVTCIIRPDHGASLHTAKKLGFNAFATSAYNGEPITLFEWGTRPPSAALQRP